MDSCGSLYTITHIQFSLFLYNWYIRTYTIFTHLSYQYVSCIMYKHVVTNYNYNYYYLDMGLFYFFHHFGFIYSHCDLSRQADRSYRPNMVV